MCSSNILYSERRSRSMSTRLMMRIGHVSWDCGARLSSEIRLQGRRQSSTADECRGTRRVASARRTKSQMSTIYCRWHGGAHRWASCEGSSTRAKREKGRRHRRLKRERWRRHPPLQRSRHEWRHSQRISTMLTKMTCNQGPWHRRLHDQIRRRLRPPPHGATRGWSRSAAQTSSVAARASRRCLPKPRRCRRR